MRLLECAYHAAALPLLAVASCRVGLMWPVFCDGAEVALSVFVLAYRLLLVCLGTLLYYPLAALGVDASGLVHW
jgi:hypothetical protein